MDTYRKDFIKAIERSTHFKFIVPEFYLESGQAGYLTKEIQGKLYELFNEEVFCHPIELVAFQCINWNIRLKKKIENLLGCEGMLTIGYVDYLSKSAFYTPLDIIASWLENSSPLPQNRYVHVWLTLPSLEIIDITLVASFLSINPNIFPWVSDYKKCMMFLPEEKLNDSPTIAVHRPQFVGVDFLYRTEMIMDGLLDENMSFVQKTNTKILL